MNDTLQTGVVSYTYFLLQQGTLIAGVLWLFSD